MKTRHPFAFWPGFVAPAFLCLAAPPVAAQTRPVAPRIVAPDQLSALKILGSTIIAVDQADKTGNYSVLLGLGSAAFQSGNSAIGLGAVFDAFRRQRIDLSDVLILSPTYQIAPTMVGPDTFRMRGEYSLPRGPLGFDLIYRWDNGWRLDAISLLPPPTAATPAPPRSPAPPAKNPARNQPQSR